MPTNINQLKKTLKSFKIEWHPLFNEIEKVEPFYFGVYKLVLKPGFETAQNLYISRLNCLMKYLNHLELKDQKAEPYIQRIKAYHNSFNHGIDFGSADFQRISLDLIIPLRRLARKRIYRLNGANSSPKCFVNDEEKKILDRFCYQLNPYNYSYHYLTHFFYVANENVTTLLVDDFRRKTIRRLPNIHELTKYISVLEIPRRNFRNSLSFRYLIYENKPGQYNNESSIYSGINYDVQSGFGCIQFWKKNTENRWQINEQFTQWRR
jgi:hypothetical protein